VSLILYDPNCKGGLATSGGLSEVTPAFPGMLGILAASRNERARFSHDSNLDELARGYPLGVRVLLLCCWRQW